MPRGIPRTKEAKHNPVILTKTIETEDIGVGQSEPRKFIGGELSPNLIQLASESEMQDAEKLENLSFMNEKVTVRIASSTDKNAEQVFEITINGKTELFRRGEVKTVRRCYVDRMCMLKETVFDCKLVESEGERQYIYPQTSGLKYDFGMVRDDNPNGQAWLKHTLALRG